MSNHFVIGRGEIRLVKKDYRLENGARPNFVISGNYCTCFGIQLLNDASKVGFEAQNIEFSVMTDVIETFSIGAAFQLMSGPVIIAIGTLETLLYASDSGWPTA